MNNEIRELKDGEEAKYHHWTSINDQIFLGNKRTKVTIDLNKYFHSYNDEPAYISYYDEDEKNYINNEQWYEHGYVHRLTGPATIDYNHYEKQYCIYGKRMSQEEWEVEVNRLLMLNEI